jgi:hypothetical protein
MKDCFVMLNYECPSCQLIKADPFMKILANILSPTLIPYSNNNSSISNNFVIPSIVVSEWTLNSIISGGQIASEANPKFILVRCLRLDSTGYEHHWPMNSSIKINDNKFTRSFYSPKDVITATQRKDHPLCFLIKDIDEVENIHNFNQKFIFKAKDVFDFQKPNKIEIYNDVRENYKDIYSYVISIDYIEICQDVSSVIKSIPIITDINRLKGILQAANSQQQLDVNYEDISLIDIYAGGNNEKRIALPARSLLCQHLSVFDLRTYLHLRRNKNYSCPFCKRKAVNLYVDGFLKKLIDEKQDLTYLSISKDYRVQPVSSWKIPSSIREKFPQTDTWKSIFEKKGEIINLEEEDEEKEKLQKQVKKEKPGKPKQMITSIMLEKTNTIIMESGINSPRANKTKKEKRKKGDKSKTAQSECSSLEDDNCLFTDKPLKCKFM